MLIAGWGLCAVMVLVDGGPGAPINDKVEGVLAGLGVVFCAGGVADGWLYVLPWLTMHM